MTKEKVFDYKISLQSLEEKVLSIQTQLNELNQQFEQLLNLLLTKL